MSTLASLVQKLQKIRHDFDSVFTQPWEIPNTDNENFLFVRIQNDTYAVSLTQIANVMTDKKIVSIQTTEPAFLGVLGSRSEIISVYHLGKFLGYSQTQAGRYHLLSTDKIAFNVDGYHGYKILPRSNIRLNDKASPFLNSMLQTDDGVYPVIDMAEIVQHLKQS